jgi:hypothetical protein
MSLCVKGTGIGTLVASRKRKNNGRRQFDAVEAITIFYLPIVPHRALHILDAEGIEYPCVTLRMSWRLIVRAFLNRWGSMLMIVGGLFLGGVNVAMALEGHRFTDEDYFYFTVLGMLFLLGAAFKIAWWFLTRRDERIKDLVGPHSLGTSDPRDWESEQADVVAKAILQQESSVSLVDVARKAVQAGNRSQAAFCLRLALRDPNDIEAQDLMDRLLAGR